MTDDIPPDVRAYLDEVARYLRNRNTGAPISVAWARYLAWTGTARHSRREGAG